MEGQKIQNPRPPTRYQMRNRLACWTAWGLMSLSALGTQMLITACDSPTRFSFLQRKIDWTEYQQINQTSIKAGSKAVVGPNTILLRWGMGAGDHAQAMVDIRGPEGVNQNQILEKNNSVCLDGLYRFDEYAMRFDSLRLDEQGRLEAIFSVYQKK